MIIDNNNLELPPGTLVTNMRFPDWGVGQVQSCINGKVTINFENVGKKVLNQNSSDLKMIENNASR
ncbi:DUF3553 domain-containing protein [Alphaproteobacteria bacterium]|nr:DUF3553 domain-containing protein [Alphaproteobacteria bacterium]